MSSSSFTFPKDTTLVFYIKYDVFHLELPADEYADQFWLGTRIFHPTGGEFHTVIADGKSIQCVKEEMSHILKKYYPGIWEIVRGYLGKTLHQMVNPIQIPRFGHQVLPTGAHVELIQGLGGLQIIGQIPGGVTFLVVNKTCRAPERYERIDVGGMYYQDVYTLLENAFRVFRIPPDRWCIKTSVDKFFQYVEEPHYRMSLQSLLESHND